MKKREKATKKVRVIEKKQLEAVTGGLDADAHSEVMNNPLG